MENLDSFFEKLYRNFNDRKIELVIAKMTEDVKWANGMDGGYVYGHDEVRQYWAKQFTMISSKVTPLIIENKNGIVRIEVHQVVYDLDQNLLANEMVEQFFHFKEDKIDQFDIGKKMEKEFHIKEKSSV